MQSPVSLVCEDVFGDLPKRPRMCRQLKDGKGFSLLLAHPKLLFSPGK